MRIEIFKDDVRQWVKEDRLQRFLDQGWQTAQSAPKKVSLSKSVKPLIVRAEAEVVKEEVPKEEAPQITMPTEPEGE
jgi:hypothetical protein